MSLSETFRDGMIKIASMYIERYEADSEGTIAFLKNTLVPVQILGSVYNYLIKDGVLPIEELTREEKIELISEVGECKNITEMCKAVYIIKKIYETV